MEKPKMESLMTLKQSTKAKNKGKAFNTLSTKEKDALLEIVCKLLNLID